MTFFQQDFNQLIFLGNALIAILGFAAFMVALSIPCHIIDMTITKWERQQKPIDYFPEEVSISTSKQPYYPFGVPVKPVPQVSKSIQLLTYNELRRLAKERGIKLKSPKKAQLIKALS